MLVEVTLVVHHNTTETVELASTGICHLNVESFKNYYLKSPKEIWQSLKVLFGLIRCTIALFALFLSMEGYLQKVSKKIGKSR